MDNISWLHKAIRISPSLAKSLAATDEALPGVVPGQAFFKPYPISAEGRMELLFYAWMWMGSVMLGGVAASRREAVGFGMILGLLFGPLGVIVALGIDDRRMCGNCHGRISGKPNVCQHCGDKFDWTKPYEPKPISGW